MKYTLEEIRAIVEFFRNHRATRSAHILEDMLKAVEAASLVIKYNEVFLLDYKYNTKPPREVIILQYLAAALAPFDFTTEEEVKP